MENFLRFENVVKAFGTNRAVDGISLSIKRGEVFALLGPSGCGKTTLLRICAGFETPDSGRVFINGVDITDMPPEKRPVHTVFQQYALFPHLSVFENIAFPLRLRGLSPTLIEKEVQKMLDMTELLDHAGKKPGKLSGGQRQRVAIARALVNRPQVLLLDEPLAALDLKLRQRMLAELDWIHDEVGITFLYVTHDQEEALGISDRIAVMNKGKIEQYGTSDGIYEYPKSRFVASFVGRMNFFEAEIREIRGENVLVQITETGANSDALFMVSKPSEKMLPAFGGQLAVGQTVLFCVRPEKFLIRAASSRDFAPGYSTEVFQNIMNGVLEREIYYGSESRFFVDVGEYSVMATRLIHSRGLSRNDEPIEQDLVLGNPVQLSWHVRDCLILPMDENAPEVIGAELFTGEGEEVGA